MIVTRFRSMRWSRFTRLVLGLTLSLAAPAPLAFALCGDVTNDGVVDAADPQAIRVSLSTASGGLAAPDQCNVLGATNSNDADANGLPDDCTLVDLVVLRRDVAGQPPGRRNVCAQGPFGIAPPDANGGAGSQEPSFDDADAHAVEIYPADGGVVLNTGEERMTRIDLAIPGRGHIHFVMTRRYRSQLNYNGPLGHGWDFSFNEALHEEPNGDVVRSNGLGHVDRWVLEPSGDYTAPAGFFATLIKNPDGSFLLRDHDGFKRAFNSEGQLSSHQDRFGNVMSFDYDGVGNLDQVVDPYARVVDFVFETQADGVDRLARIVDFTGRQLTYTYDGNGDLVQVTTPSVTGTSTGNDFPQGRTERYSYSSGFAAESLNHNLLSVTRPQEVADVGPTHTLCTYGTAGTSFDRVISRAQGGTNASGIPAGGTMTYDYQVLNAATPPGDLGVARLQASVTERNGNLFEFFANELGHRILRRRLTRGLRPGEPAAYETAFEHNGDGLVTRKVFPEGNELLYSYGSGARAAHRNVLTIRRTADAVRGGGEDLVTTLTYEPVYNQVASVIEPRGNATGFVPPIGVASAARYTTTTFYDYQEGAGPVPDAVQFGIDLSGVLRNLGELNDDGRTDQVVGNPIRTVQPTVTLLAGSNEAVRIGSTSQQILTELQWNDSGQLIAWIDPEGNRDSFDYHPENDPDGDGLTVPGQVSTIAAGYLRSKIIDANPASARRSAAASPAGLETTSDYDPVGNLVSRHNPRGIETRLEYNQLNELIVVTRGAETADAIASGQLLTGAAPFAYLTRFFRDHNGRVVLAEEENRDSNTPGVGTFVERTYSYDILDQLLERSVEIDAVDSATVQFRYDANKLPALTILPEGNQRMVEYDERDLPFRITRGFGSPEVSTNQIDYDDNMNVTRLLDAEDNDASGQPEATTMSYDGFDRRVETVDALGNRRAFSWDVASNLIQVQHFGHPADQPASPNVLLTDALYRFDELARVYQRDEPLFLALGFSPARTPDLRDGNTDGVVSTLIEFDALSRNTFGVEDDGEVTQAIYDGADRVVELVDGEGNRRTIAYDQNSNPIEIHSIEISPAGLVADEDYVGFYVWDQLDRLVHASAEHTHRWAYDSRDNITLYSDAQGPIVADPFGFFPMINDPGNTETRFHDGRNLLTAVAADLRIGGDGGQALDLTNAFNPDGQITRSYEYDTNSRLRTIEDDAGNRTTYAYDALDRRVLKTNADLTIYDHTYDRDDNLTTVIDANGTRMELTYDVLNRLTDRQITPAGGAAGTILETYGYDGLSRLTSASDDNGSAGATHGIGRVYDSLSRLLEETQDGAAMSVVWSGDGRREVLTYPGGRQLSLSYDLIDRIDQIDEGASTLVDYDWIGPDVKRFLRRGHGNGTMLSFLDDTETEALGWDEFRRPVLLRHIQGAAAVVDRDYTYNRANHRLSETRVDQDDLVDRYSYDSVYRTTRTDYDQMGGAGATPRDLTQSTYVYDGVGNRRDVTHTTTSSGASLNSHLVNEVNEYTSIAVAARLHDDNGNLADDDTQLYEFDYKNRLIGVARASDGAPLAAYEYDVLNRRVRKTVFDPAAPGSVLKTTRYLYDEWRAVEEQSSGGATETTYVYGTAIDEPVQMEHTSMSPIGAGSFYLHQNARGDVVGVTNSAGTLLEQTVYEDFGGPSQGSALGNPYLFQGRRFDPESGLYYFRMRYYDPGTGRFIQRDPVRDPINHENQYSFVGNSPATRLDPLGLGPVLDFFIGACEVAAEPVSILCDVSKSLTGWSPTENTWVDVRDEKARYYDEPKTGFNSMMGKGMEERYVRRGYSAVETITLTTVEGAVMAYPPTAVAVTSFNLGYSIGSGDARAAGQNAVGLGLATYSQVSHTSQTGSIFRVPRRVGGPNRTGNNTPVDIDPAVAREMADAGITPETPMYRATEPRYLDPECGIARANPESCAQIMDPYEAPNQYGMFRFLDAADLPDPTLNIALNRQPRGAGYNNEPGVVEIGMTFGDVLAQGGRIYPDVGAAVGGVRPFIITLPAGGIPYWTPPTLFSGSFPIVPLFYDFDFPELFDNLSVFVDDQPLTANPDQIGVAPGYINTVDVAANDSVPLGSLYVLANGGPPVPSDAFTWNGDGTFQISPLTFGPPVLTFDYFVVSGGNQSNTVTVTLTLDSLLLTDPAPDPVTGLIEVPTLLIGGQHYPMYQFILAGPDACLFTHWHSGTVYSLEAPLAGIPDPDPPVCGHGPVSAVPQVTISVTPTDWTDFKALHPPLF